MPGSLPPPAVPPQKSNRRRPTLREIWKNQIGRLALILVALGLATIAFVNGDSGFTAQNIVNSPSLLFLNNAGLALLLAGAALIGSYITDEHLDTRFDALERQLVASTSAEVPHSVGIREGNSTSLGSSIDETIRKMEELIRKTEAEAKNPDLSEERIDEINARFDREMKTLREWYNLGVLESIRKVAADMKVVLEETKTETKTLVQATAALGASSRKLNMLTEALVLLTMVLSVAGFSSYIYQVFRDQGFAVNVALGWVDVADSLVIAIIAVGFAVIVLINRPRKK